MYPDARSQQGMQGQPPFSGAGCPMAALASQVTTGARVALRNDSYTLHLLLPTKVDPLVSLMKVEKVPDSTYDMIGGLDQQIKEIKEVWHNTMLIWFFITRRWPCPGCSAFIRDLSCTCCGGTGWCC